MAGEVQFSEVLEAKLADASEQHPPRCDAGPTWTTAAFVHPLPMFGAHGARLAGAASARAACLAYSGTDRQAWPYRPPRRRLSQTQQLALDCLRGFGAAFLADDFTYADVKRAFRLLVKRFHPDSHPGAGEAERAYLARAFIRITLAYQQLTAGSVS